MRFSAEPAPWQDTLQDCSTGRLSVATGQSDSEIKGGLYEASNFLRETAMKNICRAIRCVREDTLSFG